MTPFTDASGADLLAASHTDLTAGGTRPAPAAVRPRPPSPERGHHAGPGPRTRRLDTPRRRGGITRPWTGSADGVDYSETTVRAAQSRAAALGAACHHLIGTVPGVPLSDGCADLVYTGKGALIWMPDIDAWAVEMARLLRPGAHLFLYEGHPATELWTWDLDQPRIRPDRNYFGRSFVCDDSSFGPTAPSCGSGRWGRKSPRSSGPGWSCGTFRSTPNRSGAWQASTPRRSAAAFRTRSLCWPATTAS